MPQLDFLVHLLRLTTTGVHKRISDCREARMLRAWGTLRVRAEQLGCAHIMRPLNPQFVKDFCDWRNFGVDLAFRLNIVIERWTLEPVDAWPPIVPSDPLLGPVELMRLFREREPLQLPSLPAYEREMKAADSDSDHLPPLSERELMKRRVAQSQSHLKSLATPAPVVNKAGRCVRLFSPPPPVAASPPAPVAAPASPVRSRSPPPVWSPLKAKDLFGSSDDDSDAANTPKNTDTAMVGSGSQSNVASPSLQKIRPSSSTQDVSSSAVPPSSPSHAENDPRPVDPPSAVQPPSSPLIDEDFPDVSPKAEANSSFRLSGPPYQPRESFLSPNFWSTSTGQSFLVATILVGCPSFVDS